MILCIVFCSLCINPRDFIAIKHRSVLFFIKFSCFKILHCVQNDVRMAPTLGGADKIADFD